MNMTPLPTPPNDAAKVMNDVLSKIVRPQVTSSPDITGVTPPNTEVPKMSPVTTPENKTPVAPVQVEPVKPEPPKQEPPKHDPPRQDSIETNFFTDDVPEDSEEPSGEQVLSEEDEEPDMSDIPDKPAVENWKKAREAIRNDRKALKKAEKELAAKTAEIEAWAKGEKIPDVLTAKDTRIQELEKFEIAMNGKLSEEYQELVVKPLVSTREEFTKLAENYQVPENIRAALVEKIVSTENEKERNALITRYFPDAIGANKAKELVLKSHELGQIALDMEKKPQETHQSLQAKYAEKVQAENVERVSVFEAVSKNAWHSALEKTAKEGIYSDLVMDPNNAEHNKIVEKNQHRASIQYGALVKKLFQNGLKNLPEDVAQGLARSILLSIGGVGAYKQAQSLAQELSEIKESGSVVTSYFRPSPNGNGSGMSTPAAPMPSPKTPEEAGKLASAALKSLDIKR